MRKRLSDIPVYKNGERGRLIDEGSNVEFHPDCGGYTIYNPNVIDIEVDYEEAQQVIQPGNAQ